MSKAGASTAGWPERPLPFREPFVVLGSALADVRAVPRPSRGVCAAGTVTLCAGGCGRNIAEDLARLGRRTALLAAVGDDAAGRFLLAETARAGVDVSAVRTFSGQATGCFAAVLGRGASLRQATAQTSIRQVLDEPFVRARLPALLERAGALVVELALPPRGLAAAVDLAAAASVPVCLEVARSPGVRGAPPSLAGLHLVKGSLPECRALAAALGGPSSSAVEAAATLLAAGSRAALVTMGAQGALVASREGVLRLSHPAVEALDTAGAGDAFLAGLLDASARGAGWRQAMLRGAAAARLALFSTLSCPEELGPDALDTPERATITVEALPA